LTLTILTRSPSTSSVSFEVVFTVQSLLTNSERFRKSHRSLPEMKLCRRLHTTIRLER